MKETVLLIDAGHGGIDPTTGEYTTPPSNGKKFYYSEEEFHSGGWFLEGVSNRTIAAEFIAQASKAGFICVPVYPPSEDSSLMRRVNFANHYYNEVNSKSVFISFHSNAFQSTNRGFQAYHYPNSTAGKALAEAVIATTQKTFLDYGSNFPYPLKNAEFAVLRGTIAPAILLELGFFDNLSDANLLFSNGFRVDIVNSIVEGLDKYLD